MKADDFIDDVNEGAIAPRPVSTSKLQKLQRQRRDLQQKQALWRQQLSDIHKREAEARADINRKRNERAQKLHKRQKSEKQAEKIGRWQKDIEADEK